MVIGGSRGRCEERGVEGVSPDGNGVAEGAGWHEEGRRGLRVLNGKRGPRGSRGRRGLRVCDVQTASGWAGRVPRPL